MNKQITSLGRRLARRGMSLLAATVMLVSGAAGLMVAPSAALASSPTGMHLCSGAETTAQTAKAIACVDNAVLHDSGQSLQCDASGQAWCCSETGGGGWTCIMTAMRQSSGPQAPVGPATAGPRQQSSDPAAGKTIQSSASSSH
jgi:hypothetical protein